MTWEARLRGRNSAVVDEGGFGVLVAMGPLSRSEEEHHANVLKAAAAPEMLKKLKACLLILEAIQPEDPFCRDVAEVIGKAEPPS